MFLGSEPSGVQSYTLIGDRSSTVHVATVYPNHSINLLDPSSPIQTGLLIEQADLIAKGLSRFSFLPPWSVDAGPFVMLPTEKLKALPGQLGVECQPSPDDNRVVEVVLASLVANPTAAFQSVKIDSTIHFQAILNCDYGNATSYRTISTASKNNGWRVRSKFPFTHPIITFLEGTSNLRLCLPLCVMTIWQIVRRTRFGQNFSLQTTKRPCLYLADSRAGRISTAKVFIKNC
jgi:hypothetical protein